MIHNLNRVTAATLLLFMIMAVGLLYWSVGASDSLLARGDNPRRVEFEQGLQRGALYDQAGVLLARTVPGDRLSPSGKPIMRRDYPELAAASAVGYYSFTYGVGGAEEAYNAILRGDDRLDAWDRANDSLFHHPQQGADVRLTIDLALQGRIIRALGQYRGAAIVIDVPSGAVRALVSAPSYDPNTLERTFKDLQKAPNAPLLNRVTQGLYQPGGALQPVILKALLVNKTLLDPVENGAQPLTLDTLNLTCAVERPTATLQDAFANACPRPFVENSVANVTAIQNALDSFGLTSAPRLIGFRTLFGGNFKPLSATDSTLNTIQKEAAGQGALIVSPLQMVRVAALIANHGTPVTPYLADAIRIPGADWTPIPIAAEPTVIGTAQPTSDKERALFDAVRLAMRQAVQQGAASPADQPGAQIFGHTSYAYSGPQTGSNAGRAVSWFIGFLDRGDGTSLAVAVVLEDTLDPGGAARIGKIALSQTSP